MPCAEMFAKKLCVWRPLAVLGLVDLNALRWRVQRVQNSNNAFANCTFVALRETPVVCSQLPYRPCRFKINQTWKHEPTNMLMKKCAAFRISRARLQPSNVVSVNACRVFATLLAQTPRYNFNCLCTYSHHDTGGGRRKNFPAASPYVHRNTMRCRLAKSKQNFASGNSIYHIDLFNAALHFQTICLQTIV